MITGSPGHVFRVICFPYLRNAVFNLECEAIYSLPSLPLASILHAFSRIVKHGFTITGKISFTLIILQTLLYWQAFNTCLYRSHAPTQNKEAIARERCLYEVMLHSSFPGFFTYCMLQASWFHLFNKKPDDDPIKLVNHD